MFYFRCFSRPNPRGRRIGRGGGAKGGGGEGGNESRYLAVKCNLRHRLCAVQLGTRIILYPIEIALTSVSCARRRRQSRTTAVIGTRNHQLHNTETSLLSCHRPTNNMLIRFFNFFFFFFFVLWSIVR